ncbi:MAG TPA: hypothetical protein VGH28_16735 [Polyangiaceae bacterium]
MDHSSLLTAAGALLVVAGTGWSLLRRRRVVRALALAGPPESRRDIEDGTVAAVEGTLRASAPLVTRIPTGSESPVRAVLGADSDIPEDARVETEQGDVVMLDGEAQIIVGSEERAARGGSVHTARDGDRVRARGRMVRAALPASLAGATRGYRDSAHAHKFAPESAPTVVVATNGPRPFTPSWVLVLAGMPLVGFGVWSYADTHPADPAASLAKAQAAFERGDFGDAHERFADARLVDPSRAPTVAEIQSAALAHDYESAHALTVALEKVWYPGPASTEKTRMECIADAWASRAAGGARAGTLVKPKRDDLWCDYLAADLESDHDARMWALQCDDDDYDTRRLLFLEDGERGAWFTAGERPYIEDYPLGALYDPAAWIAKRHIALEDAVATTLDQGELSFEVLAQAALYRAVMGDAPAAKKFLERMLKPGASRSPYILGAIAAAYVYDDALVERLLELGANDANAVGVIRRDVLPALRGTRPEIGKDEPWNADIDAGIRAHDAQKVADAFAKGGKTHRYEALRVRAVFEPRELGPLRTWLRDKFPSPAWEHGVNAVGLRLGDELALAEAFGDAELAASSVRASRSSKPR